MTSYLFVVRVPIEKELIKENDKGKSAKENESPVDSISTPISSECESEPKPKVSWDETEESESSTSPNKETSVSDKETVNPGPKADVLLKETPLSEEESTKDIVDKSEETEDNSGNEVDEPEKNTESSDVTDVEWDFGDETTEKSATDKNVTSEHEDEDKQDIDDAGGKDEAIGSTPEAGVDDVEWDLSDKTRETTVTVKNATPGEVKQLLPEKLGSPSDKEEDKISLSRFTVEPSSDVETAGSDAEKEKTAISSESDSRKFVVENVSTPVVKDLNENKLLNEVSAKLVTIGEVSKENPNNTVPVTSMSNAKPAEKNKLNAGPVKSALKSSSSKKMKDEEKKTDVVFFITKEPLVKVVLDIVNDFGIDNVTVSKTENEQCHQIIFVDEGGERCENILNKLSDVGIGNKIQTSVSIYQSKIFRGAKDDQSDEDFDDDGEDDEENEKKESEFMKSIKARMLVSEVVDSVRSNAEFTFDYLLLVILASIISGLGLVENSSVILVASMLISPLMGPILAGTFGAVIRNNSLRNLGLKSESLGLFICMFSGFCFGLISGGVSLKGANWGSTDMWPTNEMMSRGTLRSLWVGILIALPSGAGVALSVLGGNTGSLVGVAISASLLPPAVNAGMLWAYALLAGIIPPPTVHVDNQNITSDSTSSACPAFVNNKYVPVYDCNMATEAAFLGLVSLSLTLINILCIIIVALVVLKIKEVAPQASVSNETRKFWGEDIQIARESYVTSKGPMSLTLAQQARELMDQWRRENGHEPVHTLHVKQMMEEVENSDEVKEVLGKIAFKSKPFSSSLNKDFRRAEEDYTMSFISDQKLFNNRDVYKTFHGISGNTVILPSPGIFPKRSHSFNKRKPKVEKLDTVDEIGSGNITLKSSLYNRRKKSGNLSDGRSGDKDPLIEDTVV